MARKVQGVPADMNGSVGSFNRREDEFESLLDYNNYLEDAETMTFNLVNGIDVDENRRKLNQYREANLKSITRNATLASDEKANQQAHQAAEREQAKMRREAAQRQEMDERRERDEGRRTILDNLTANAGNADRIARDGERVMLKRASQRRAEADGAMSNAADVAAPVMATNGSASGFTVRGLKRRVESAPDAAYDAFGGLTLAPAYHVLLDEYEWDWLNEARNSVQMTAGGYNVGEYCQRALRDAFSGLGVLVSDEVSARDVSRTGTETEGAAGGERRDGRIISVS